jgi:acetaldehyde dehydrogenase (acetylating)
VLSFYVVKDWREGCERCKQILRYGGMGHTMSIHSKDDDIILQFGLHKPAYRIVVNTPTTHGSIGLTTGLDPAMTLGCGGFGGNITSDNISPMHLLNIKRLAYEVQPAVTDRPMASAAASAPSSPSASSSAPRAEGISAETLRARIDTFLASRGYSAQSAPQAAAQPAPAPAAASPPAPAPSSPPAPSAPREKPAEFVCEDDVRQAVKASRKIVIGERTIITPAARDLGEQHRVFTDEGSLR